MANIESSPEFVSAAYAQMRSNIAAVKKSDDRALPLAEKIVFGHIDDVGTQKLDRGKAYLNLRPDRVALQDATAQMALLQFMMAGKNEAAVPTTVHCDHLIRGHVGAAEDLTLANEENR